jgi:UDP-glucuronate decarboxylase
MGERRMKNILVTGGQGFIGVNLCKSLADDGHKVWCLDNMRCPSPIMIRDDPRVNFLQGSVELITPKAIATRTNNTVFHEIYYLASIASPVWYKQYPMETITTNVMGTMAMCELARVHGAKLLLTSTSEVYGDPEQIPQKEEYCGNVNVLSDRACYDESKRTAETIVENARLLYDIKTTIVRIFNTYGPGMRVDDGRVVSEFLVRAIQGRSLPIFGGGQMRCFCYVNDMVIGLKLAMASRYPGPTNLGSTHGETITDFAKIIQNMFSVDKPIKIEHKGRDKHDPQQRMPDVTRAKKILKWEPKVGLAGGLIATRQYFEKLLEE